MIYFALEQALTGYILYILWWYFGQEYIAKLVLVLIASVWIVYRYRKVGRKFASIIALFLLSGFVFGLFTTVLFHVNRQKALDSVSGTNSHIIKVTTFGEPTAYGRKFGGCVITSDEKCAKVILQTSKGVHMRYGQLVAVEGVLKSYNSETPYHKYMWSLDYIGELHVGGDNSYIITDSTGYADAIENLRGSILSRLSELRYPANQIIPGILIGSKDNLDSATKEGFVASGLIHILVLSGFNITILAATVYFLLYWLPAYVRISASILASLFLVQISGSEEPAVRALITTSIVLIFVPMLSNAKNIIRLTAYAASVVLIVSPETVNSISFQLSTLATLAVFTSAQICQKINSSFIQTTIVTVVATIFTAPTILLISETLNLASIAANIVSAPAVPLIMGSGVLYLLIPTRIFEELVKITLIPVSYSIQVFGYEFPLLLHISISRETANIINMALVSLLILSVYFLCNMGKANQNSNK